MTRSPSNAGQFAARPRAAPSARSSICVLYAVKWLATLAFLFAADSLRILICAAPLYFKINRLPFDSFFFFDFPHLKPQYQVIRNLVFFPVWANQTSLPFSLSALPNMNIEPNAFTENFWTFLSLTLFTYIGTQDFITKQIVDLFYGF